MDGGRRGYLGCLSCLLGAVQQPKTTVKGRRQRGVASTVLNSDTGQEKEGREEKKKRKEELMVPCRSRWRCPGCCRGRSDREMCWDE